MCLKRFWNKTENNGHLAKIEIDDKKRFSHFRIQEQSS